MCRGLQDKAKQDTFGKLRYLLLIVPLVLAYLSWYWFPIFAEQVTLTFYQPKTQPTHWLWYVGIRFYYTWFTFLTIGGAGTFAVAAWLARQKHVPTKLKEHPTVSFIVPAYNEERQVAQCISSLFECASEYEGLSEIIVIDDGSKDYTYEIAWATIEYNRKAHPNIRGKVVRLSANQGKIEAIKTGVNKALGNVIAIVDADSQWSPSALKELLAYMQKEGKAAVTGYIHPTGKREMEENTYIRLQQLEYSQGVGVFRNAQDLGNTVFIIPGPIGLYDAAKLRMVLENVKSVTEDLEIALEMQKRGFHVGYIEKARSTTVAPSSLKGLWHQRLRWFMGWVHNTLGIHRDLLYKNRGISLLIWYCLITEYVGAIIEVAALVSLPFLFWFAPDKVLFLLNLPVFLAYALLVGATIQAVALKFAYNRFNYRWLLFYTPLYAALRLVNMAARLASIVSYARGDKGNWHSNQGTRVNRSVPRKR